MLVYKDSSEAVPFLVNELTKRTKLHDVLWFVSGGSSMNISNDVAKKLPDEACRAITVAQVDERYGQPGHPEDNWRKLIHSGFPAERFKQTESILHADMSRDKVVAEYENILKKLLSEHTHIVGLFGVGEDGHTGGIKPDVSDFEELFLSRNYVAGYEAQDFERITITRAVIERLELAVLYAAGSHKVSITDRVANDTTYELMPVQLLKLADDLVIFRDES